MCASRFCLSIMCKTSRLRSCTCNRPPVLKYAKICYICPAWLPFRSHPSSPSRSTAPGALPRSPTRSLAATVPLSFAAGAVRRLNLLTSWEWDRRGCSHRSEYRDIVQSLEAE